MKMIELKLTPSHFLELIKKGYSLDHIFLLKMIKETEEDYTFNNTTKAENLIRTLVRKGLIDESASVTQEGEDLISFLSSTSDTPKIPRKRVEVKSDAFDKWWKAYPPTDTFEYKGRKFKGTRALKVKKNECRAKIEKILKVGEYTIDDLIAALELEIEQKCENSIKTGQNKMSYMQNSLTYLNQCTYEAFIELIKSGYKPTKNKTEDFDGINI